MMLLNMQPTRRSVLTVLLALSVAMAAGCSRPKQAGGGAANKASSDSKNSVQPAQADAEDSTEAQLEFKSVFIDAADFGRDPFFPNSTRRGQNRSTENGIEEGLISSYLKLTGIWPRQARPLALINQTTFAPGETAQITVVIPVNRQKSETRKITVQCLEIRADSVLIRVEGEPEVKELHMKSTF
jgi:hypothetical protein